MALILSSAVADKSAGLSRTDPSLDRLIERRETGATRYSKLVKDIPEM
jgi:hypothetical protein